ncbi:MAG TPA: dihydrofolate reductase family protein [Pyrinomonadaceae bacterium]|nr:dihydrofolate reductase family protein [Pyrinomonadaceae bacterium]
MGKLIYITNTSLDGYIEDEKGNFDWLNADQVHEFITELVRPMQTYLLGRRLYETMVSWESPMESFPSEQRAFAEVWQKFEKIVFSRTLTDVKGNARLERDFDVDAIRKLKQESEHDISIGGAEIAGVAIEANLVDECHLFLYPIIIGGGKPAFPPGLRRRLELIETSNFSTGVIHVRYRIST